MTRSRVGLAWSLLSLAVAEILNPLLLISSALFLGAGYILTLFMPVNIDIWATLLLVCIALPLAFLTVRARRLWQQGRANAVRFSWRCFLPIIPLLVFLPPAVALLMLPSLNSIAHVDLYFPYIIQIYHGSTPLHNTLIPGAPANQYWLFYALIAAVMKLTSFDIYTVFNLSNYIFLLSALYWLAQSLLTLGLAKARTIWFGALILFVFCSVNATGVLTVFLNALNGHLDLDNLSLMMLGGADRRLHSIMLKVFHASGMTPGVTAFTASLYILVKTSRGELGLHLLILLSAAGIAALAIMPIVAVFIAVSLAGGFVVTTIFETATARKGLKSIVESFIYRNEGLSVGSLAVWIVISLVLALPLFVYIDEFTYNYQSSILLHLVAPVNLRMLLASTLLLLPPAGLQIADGLKNRSRQERFLGFSAIFGIILALSAVLPDQNQYKFHFLLSMLLALLSLLLLQNASERRGAASQRAIRIFTYALIALAISNAVLGAYAVINRAIGAYGIVIRYENAHIIPVYDIEGRLPAFNWIRNNTPADSIVMVPHDYTKLGPLVHGRLSYVTEGGYTYSENIPEHGQRLIDLHEFYDPSTTLEMYLADLETMKAQLPGTPLYAVVMEPELSRETMAQRGAQLVFEKPSYGAHVYLLNPPAAS